MSARAESQPTQPTRLSARVLGWLLPIGFATLAVALFAAPPAVPIPVAQPMLVDRAELVVGPRRNAMADPPHIQVAGVEQSCAGCHQIFSSAHGAGETLSYHREIVLSHGLNNRCVNCHAPDDRQRLTLRDGTTVPYSQTPQLCAQCHGTVYRDWQKGTHGKTLGSWITDSAEQHRLSCNECHNPHAPKYDPYQPLPGPSTLRMGDQGPHPGAERKQSPLQRWLTRQHPRPSDEDSRHGGHE